MINAEHNFDKVAAKLLRQSKEAEQRVKDAVLKSTLQVEAGAKERAAVKSGKLRSSIKSRITNEGLTGEVEATAAHAAYVEYNTRAHIIRPKKKKVLRFKKGGQWVFRKVVFHPGTKEQPFMRPSLADEKPRFVRDLNNIMGGGRS